MGLENVLNLESSTGMAASLNNGHSVGRFEMENGDCNFLARPIYKRRKVSAVRDFPEGCGPSASRTDPVLRVDTTGFGSSANDTIVEDKNGEHSGADTVRTSQCEHDSRHSELPAETLGQTNECSLKNEIPVISPHQVDGPPLGNDEPGKVPLEGVETLADTELGRIAKLSSPMGEEVLSLDSKSLSSNVDIAGSSACIENMTTRRYFPRRKVSAVRDFPPLCGRNAPCLSTDEGLKGITSFNDMRVVQQNMAVDDDLSQKVAATDGKEVENNIHDEHARKRKLADTVLAGSEGNATVKVNKLDAADPSFGMKSQQRNTKEKHIVHPGESNHHQVEINSLTGVKEANEVDIQVEGTSGLEIIVYPEVQSLEAEPLRVAYYREVVLGLMAKSECPWRSDNGSSKVKLIRGIKESKGNKADSFSRLGRSKYATKTIDGTNNSGQRPLKKKKENAASSVMGPSVIPEKKDSVDPSENVEDFQVVTKSHNVNVTPFGHRNLSGHENDTNMIRHKVRETLRLFQAVCRKLLQEVEAKNERGSNSKRVDFQAAKILKDKGKYINSGKQILGPVPGVEVGDEFQYRVELNIIGVHRQIQGGIDYVRHNGKVLATSIVASGGYADELDNSDVLIYTGQGGNVMNSGKEPEDQKLERGNLALKNSSEEKNPVRVIRGSESADGKSKIYVYDGLYVVESSWQDMGPHGKLVYRFRLRRIPGQPELALKEVKKSKKFKTREGLCFDDISYGIERIPICAVNTIDDEKPPPFKYITSMIYPDCNLISPKGCDCTNGCSDSAKCSCVVRNGGEIPFNHNGAIVETKPLVYECGPSCKCPSTCYNRVSQHGIKFQLEIFKTPTRGWGVRSLNSIPSGSFICEYIGELLEEKEAEQRTGNDEYLFDIGNNYSNSTLWDGLSTLIPDAQPSSCEVVKDGAGFTIDAAQYANVGRFINHSCSPNLYAQNVLYDHHDKRMPHIMFFAAENIPPLQELTYDYNYMIGQVRDSDGNIKRKDCYCGSVECTGRMY